MTTEAFDRYQAALEGRLKILGLSRESAVSFGDRVRDFDADVSAVRWSSEGRSFLISSGCAKYPGSASGWCDEFLVEESGGKEFSLKLLEMTVYYHLTLRPLEISDVIGIGTMPENTSGYSHIFSSVPFFLPGSVNVIEFDKTRFALQWLMPIFPKEAVFIEKHGSDEFEKRLKTSQYDYFDDRSDLGYLDQ
jgi:hypothetical protein